MSKRRYILREPITAEQLKDRNDWLIETNLNCYHTSDYGTQGYTMFRVKDFEELFVEFDRETLKQQIAEILLALQEVTNEIDCIRRHKNKPDGMNDREYWMYLWEKARERSVNVLLDLLDPKGETDD